MRRRPDLFPPDRRLQARMAFALVVNLALLAGVVALAAWAVRIDRWPFVVAAAGVIALGIAVEAWARRESGGVTLGRGPEPERARRPRVALDPERERALVERVEAVARRLCIAADVRMPAVMVSPHTVPLSWTGALPGRVPVLHLTEPLVESVSDRGLEVVVAHELAHLANRDAHLMTVIAGPSAWMLSGVGHMAERFFALDNDEQAARWWMMLVLVGWYMGPIALVLLLSSRVVSRHRELAADRGAALLVGSAAVVAATLSELSDGLAAAPSEDLRSVRAHGVFYLLPVGRADPRGIRRVVATHPPLRRRLRQLERIEASIHSWPASRPA